MFLRCTLARFLFAHGYQLRLVDQGPDWVHFSWGPKWWAGIGLWLVGYRMRHMARTSGPSTTYRCEWSMPT